MIQLTSLQKIFNWLVFFILFNNWKMVKFKLFCRLAKTTYAQSGSKSLSRFLSLLQGLRPMTVLLLALLILLSIHCLIRYLCLSLWMLCHGYMIHDGKCCLFNWWYHILMADKWSTEGHLYSWLLFCWRWGAEVS